MILYYILDYFLPPLSALPVLDQTPFLHTISSLVDSSEHRSNLDAILNGEPGSIYSVYLDFMCLFWPDERPPGYRYDCLRKCKGGPKSLFKEDNGWNDWPANA
jgi:hypothetical protein